MSVRPFQFDFLQLCPSGDNFQQGGISSGIDSGSGTHSGFDSDSDVNGNNNCLDVFQEMLDDERNDCAPLIAANNEFSAQLQALQELKDECAAVGEDQGFTCFKDVNYIMSNCGLADASDPALYSSICDRSTLCGKAMYRVEMANDCTTVNGIDYAASGDALKQMCTPHYSYDCGCPEGYRETVPYTGPFGPEHECSPIPASDLYTCICPPGYTEVSTFERHPWSANGGTYAPPTHKCVPPATLAPTMAPTASPTKYVRTGDCYAWEFATVVEGVSGCAMLTNCTSLEFELVAPTSATDRECQASSICEPTSEFESAAPTVTSDRECASFTLCTLGETYEAQAPTSVSNRVCEAIRTCDFQTQFEAALPTLLTDRVCTDLEVCTDTQFEATEPSLTSNRVCQAMTVCSTVEPTEFQEGFLASGDRNCQPHTVCEVGVAYESNYPTAFTDRACTPYTECNLGFSYETVAFTYYTNRVCSPVRQCNGASEYESVAATLVEDRTCAPLTICAAGTFQASAPIPGPNGFPVANRVCQTLTVCTAAQYQLGSQPNGDRNCQPLTVCTDAQYQVQAPTAINDRLCDTLAQCVPGQNYETIAPTATENRFCSPVVPCDLLTQYQSAAPTALANYECSPQSTCTASEYENAKPGPATDRDCQPLSDCTVLIDGMAQFQAGFLPSGDRNCLVVRQCKFTEYVSSVSSEFKDRGCSALTVCSQSDNNRETTAPIGAGTFSNPYTANRVCSPYTKCNFKTHYESSAPVGNTDRVCSAISPCDTATQYQTAAPTTTTNRACAPLTVCDNDSQFQVGFLLSGDRNCKALTTCEVTTQYQFAAPAANTEGKYITNRKCRATTECVVGKTYQTSAPSTVANRECTGVTKCNFKTHYESSAPTLVANRACSALLECTVLEYETSAPTQSANRECTALTPCDTATDYLTGFANTGNLACSTLTLCDSTNNANDIPTEYEAVGAVSGSIFGITQNIGDRMCATAITCDAATQDVSGAGAAARCGSKAYSAPSRRLLISAERKAANFWLQSASCTGTQYWTTCKTDGTQYMTAGDPCLSGAENTPICAAVNACDSDQQYMTAEYTTTTDRQCADLTTCTIGSQYESSAPSSNTNRVCTDIKTCTSDEYQTSAPTASADRVCATGTSCTAAEYESQAMSAIANRVCSTLTSCTKFQYASTAPTTTSDRVCTTAGFCGDSQYISNGGSTALTTGTDNYNCQPLTPCETTQYQNTAPADWKAAGSTQLTDAEKAAYTTASTYSVMYVSDRNCEDIKTCTDNEFEGTAATLTTDRTCTTGAVCASSQYASTAISLYADRVCSDLATCNVFQYESTAPTASTDRGCTNAGYCGVTQYISNIGTLGTANYACESLTGCSSTQYQTVAPIDWMNVTVGANNQLTADQKTEYTSSLRAGSDFTKMYVSNRECDDLQVCAANAFASTEETATSDRVCTVGQTCASDQYESVSMTLTSDRVCTDLTVCSYFQFESVAPAVDGKSNRVCAALLQCSPSMYISNWASFSGTTNHPAQVECLSLTACDVTQYQTVAPTDQFADLTSDQQTTYTAATTSANTMRLITDRTCEETTVCDSTQYETTAKTSISNRICTAGTVCNATESQYPQYQSASISASADRTCSAVSTCAKTEYTPSGAAPTSTSDRACSTAGFCSNTFYLTNPAARGINNSECTALVTCSELQYESTAPVDWMQTNDLTQADKYLYGNASTYANMFTADRSCTTMRTCTAGVEYESVAPSANTAGNPNSDRTCQTGQTCASNEYESIPISPSADRTCSAIRTCTDLEYQSAAPTTTSNRACTAQSACADTAYVTNFEEKGVTEFSCTLLTVCGEGYYEATPPDDWMSAGATTEQKATLSSAGNSVFYTSDRECLLEGFTLQPTFAPTFQPTVLAVCDYSKQWRNYIYPESPTVLICVDHTKCNAATQYETAVATETSDRTCATLLTCNSTVEYETTAPTFNSNRACTAKTICNAATQYETLSATALSDRTCAALTTCLIGTEYQSVAASTTSDRVCSAVTTCPSGSFIEKTAPTTIANRKCEAVIACDLTTQYRSAAATATEQAVCSDLKVCVATGAAQEYESAAPTMTTDRDCTAYNYCTNLQYMSGFQESGDFNCATLNLCNGASEYVKTSAATAAIAGVTTATTDNVCATEVSCDAANFNKTGVGAAAICTAKLHVARRLRADDHESRRLAVQVWNKCPSSQYQTGGDPYTAGAGNAPTCAALTICSDTWQFQATAPTAGAGDNSDSFVTDRICTLLSVCHPITQYKTVLKTSTSDRECANIRSACAGASTGNYKQGGEYESAAPTTTSNRVCTAGQTCDVISHFVSSGLTLTSDRVCTLFTACNTGIGASMPLQYMHTAPVFSVSPPLSSDRICATATICAMAKGLYVSNQDTFMAQNPANEDITCGTLTPCDYSTQFMTLGLRGGAGTCLEPYYIAQQTCSTLTPACDLASEYESTSPNAVTVDRSCSALTVCDETADATVGGGPREWESQAPSLVTDRVCTSTTASPTQSPTASPSTAPTKFPTRPTMQPTVYPTPAPSPQPTSYPTKTPTAQPTTSNKDVLVLDDYFKGCKVYQDCGSTGTSGSRNAHQDPSEPSCDLLMNNGRCTTYSAIVIDDCQTIMDATKQTDSCIDIGTGLKLNEGGISHTSSSAYTTTTILTTILDTAEALNAAEPGFLSMTQSQIYSYYGGNYALTRPELEAALGGNIGTIGSGDPVAAVRNPQAAVGSLTYPQAQKRLAWNSQITTAISLVRNLIELQAKAITTDANAVHFAFVKTPTTAQYITPVAQVHSAATLAAMKATIATIKAQPAAGRRGLSGRKLAASASFLGDETTLKSLVAAGFESAKHSMETGTTNNQAQGDFHGLSGTMSDVDPLMLNALVKKVAAVNAMTATAANDGLLDITKLNTYNYMQNSIKEEGELLLTGKKSVSEFESATTLAVLEEVAGVAVAAAEDAILGTSANPTTMPTIKPTMADATEKNSVWQRYSAIFIVAIIVGLLALAGTGYHMYHNANEANYNEKWMVRKGFKPANPFANRQDQAATPVDADELDDALAQIGTEAEPQAFGDDTVDLHSVDV
jgi:hypothetical protein